MSVSQETSSLGVAIILGAGNATRNEELANLGPNSLNEVGGTVTFGILTRQLGSKGLGLAQAIVVVSPQLTAVGVPAEAHYEGYLNGRPWLHKDLLSSGKEQSIIDGAGPRRQGMKYSYVTQSPDLAGTGAAFGATLDILEDIMEADPKINAVAVLNGDGFDPNGETNIRNLAAKVRTTGSSLGILTTAIPKLTSGRYQGGIMIRNDDGELQRINENPDHDEVSGEGDPEYNAGMYIVRRDIFPIARAYLNVNTRDFGTPGNPGKLNQKEHYITDLFGLATREGLKATSLVVPEGLADCSTFAKRRLADEQASRIVADYAVR